MKALTVRLERRDDGQPGFTVTLAEGTPAAPGPTLQTVTVPALATAVRNRLDAARDQLLTETGRLADLATHAADVAGLILPGTVGTTWATAIATARQEVTRWQQT